MKQINEYKNKNFELRENCILEKLTNFIFKSNKSLNRNPQKQQVSNKVFFITLIFVCLSPCLVDAYAGNDAVYTIPSQHKSKQVNKILIVELDILINETSKKLFNFILFCYFDLN